MTRFKCIDIPQITLAMTMIVMILINITFAVANSRESFDSFPMIRRALVQAHGGNPADSSSVSVAHAATGSSSIDHASAGGMHGKWANGLDGKPKDLQAYHASQRALYERPPVIPTEGIPHGPGHPSTTPSPAPSPGPSSNPQRQGRNLRTQYSDQGKVKPIQAAPASGPTGAGSSSKAPVHSPASAPSPSHKRERIPDEPFPPPSKGGSGRKLLASRKSRLREKTGSMNKRSFTIEDTDTMTKRSDGESFESQPIIKRAMVQAHGGTPAGSSTTSVAHGATGTSSTDNASAGGMHGKWANGLDGKPKDLQAYHASQRALYERPPGGYPTEPIPYTPKHPKISPSSSPSPSPAPSPAPSSNAQRQGRSLRTRYSDQGPIGPAAADTSPPPKSSSPSPAPAPSPRRERFPDEPYPGKAPPPPSKAGSGRQLSGSKKSRLRVKIGPSNKRSLTVEETNTMVKRSVVPASGSAAGGSGGANYSGTNVHSTSQSGHYGQWANGESGRPIHPNERVLFHPTVLPPNVLPSMPHTKNQAPSPSPASAPSHSPASAPSPSGRRLLAEKPSKKCRLREKC